MELLNRLTDDMKTAMKSGQKDRLSVIRMLLSDVKNIDLMPNKPTAEQVVEAYGKKLRKSMEEYEKIGKPDEVAKPNLGSAAMSPTAPPPAIPESMMHDAGAGSANPTGAAPPPTPAPPSRPPRRSSRRNSAATARSPPRRTGCRSPTRDRS